MRRSTIRALRVLVGLFALVACSSSKPLTSEPTVCTAPGYHVDSEAVTIDRVEATLHDPSGTAVANLPVQVCGINQCFTGSTGPAGKTTVTPHTALVLPAFKYGDGFEFAELAVLLDGTPSQNLGELAAVPLPSYADGAQFPKSGTVQNGDLTLLIDSTTVVAHDRLTYSDDSRLVFRSAQIPLAQSSRALDPSFGFELAYGVAPLGTTFCPAARVSLKNTLAWPAATAIELFVQGLDVSQKWAPYGSWLKVADASVSSDGRSIDTTGGGIPILSAIAVRRK